MRFSGAALLPLAAAMIVAPAAAQTDYYNTDAGRPVRVEDASVIERYAFDLEPFPVAMQRTSTNVYRYKVEPHVGYGVLPMTQIELGAPLVLMVSRGGIAGTIALCVMLLFHIHITSTFALGVPLEWNLFMIFGLGFLFGHYGDVPFSTLDNPLLIVVLVTIGVVVPVLGNLFPDKISFLPGMRYYAGNWASSLWLFRKDKQCEGKLNSDCCGVAPVVIEQLAAMYDRETAEYLMYKSIGFRALHSHGRALLALAHRATGNVDDYEVRDGELVSGVVNGWNFGDGHFHDQQLLEAVQERCGFEVGDLRVVFLESQPAQTQRQRYRLYDAAAGLIEEGWVDVAEMLKRGPWLDGSWDFPVEVITQARPPEPAATPAS